MLKLSGTKLYKKGNKPSESPIRILYYDKERDYKIIYDGISYDLEKVDNHLVWNIPDGIDMENLKISIQVFDEDTGEELYTTNEVTLNKSVENISAAMNMLMNFSTEMFSNEYPIYEMTDDQAPMIITDKKIAVPSNLQAIVSKDNVSQLLTFEINRYYDGVDLSQKACSIKYSNAEKGTGRAIAVNVQVSNEKLILGWVLDDNVTMKQGKVKFAIEFLGKNEFDQVYVWQTVPAEINIAEGLHIDETTIEEKYPTVIEDILIQLSVLESLIGAGGGSGGGGDVTKAYVDMKDASVLTDAKTYTDAGIAEIELLPGPSGKGITSTTITYQASVSGTITPTGTWLTTIPNVSASQYLWTRTVLTYSDSTTSTSYSVGMMGAKGDTGTSATVAVGTTTTLSAGSNATVTNSGTAQNVVLNFGIPKGADGSGSGGGSGDSPVTSVNGQIGDVNLTALDVGALSSSGVAISAEKLQTACSIGNVSFDGTSSITLSQIGAASSNDLANKVDKVAGKGLSSEDYTSSEKTKLTGIETGANNYTHPTGDGNLHVPATGAVNNGKVLRAGASAGSVSWGALSATDVGAISVTEKGVSNGIATLNSTGKLAQMPTVTDIGALSSTGTAIAATKLATPRNIGSAAFDGTQDITVAQIGAPTSAEFNTLKQTVDGLSGGGSSGIQSVGQGSGISINTTDTLNPVVSVSSGVLSDIGNISNKLDKATVTTSNPQAYVKDTNGTQAMIDVSSVPANGNIPRWGSGGQLQVAAAISNNMAVNLQQMNNAISGITGGGGGPSSPQYVTLWTGEIYGGNDETITLSDSAMDYRVLYIFTNEGIIPVFPYGLNTIALDPDDIRISGSIRYLVHGTYDSIEVSFLASMSASGETFSNIYSGKIESYYFNEIVITQIIGEK